MSEHRGGQIGNDQRHNGAGGNGRNGHSNAEAEMLRFPCRYEIKAMGRDNSRFTALVQSIVTQHVDTDGLLGVRSRSSRQGTYVSVSCRIMARDRDQLHAIYADLRACAEVLMTL
ncbi:MAG: DUF493 domain-containing protein [Gammaproteobacteria bacterium]|nr:DUF493 domain-containing protein [Gammaproteobacteria bacterium]MDH3465285.1 DUF493 domain-containing protein [Gammaproteobacteria bacterium]